MLVSFLLLLISASLHLWGYLILLFSHISNNLLHFSISFSNFFQTSSTFSTLLIISIYFCLQVPWDRAHSLSIHSLVPASVPVLSSFLWQQRMSIPLGLLQMQLILKVSRFLCYPAFFFPVSSVFSSSATSFPSTYKHSCLVSLKHKEQA